VYLPEVHDAELAKRIPSNHDDGPEHRHTKVPGAVIHMNAIRTQRTPASARYARNWSCSRESSRWRNQEPHRYRQSSRLNFCLTGSPL
jgi:hypothetical protein